MLVKNTNTDCMSSRWKTQYMDVLYSSKTDEEKCDDIKVLRYCVVDGVRALVTVIGYSICLEKGFQENSAMTSSERRVLIAGSQTESGYIDGPGLEARFNEISDIVVDEDGENVIICDQNSVRKMDLNSYNVVTLCIRPDSLNAELSGVPFERMNNVCIDHENNIYLSDSCKNRIYKMDQDGKNIVTFFDNVVHETDSEGKEIPSFENSMMYDGDDNLKQYCVLESPTTIMIQDNKDLIILNQGKQSLCKVSLYLVDEEGRKCETKEHMKAAKRYYSVVKYGLEFDSTFTVDMNGDIIVCENKKNGNVAFHIILSTGDEMHIADKKGPAISVMQVAIRHDYDSGGICFFTIEIENGKSKIVKTTIGSQEFQWDKLRSLFMKLLKAGHSFFTPLKLLEYQRGNSPMTSKCKQKLLDL